MKTVVHVITGLNDGGAEGSLFRLCTYPQPGARHIVVSLGSAGVFGPRLTAAGVEVHCLEMPRGRVTLGGLNRLYRLLRRLRPDAVQTWMYHANLLGGIVARIAGARRIFWNIRHTEIDRGATGRSTMLVNRLCARLSSWLPVAVVACAHRAVETHTRLGYSGDRFVVIANGYDLTEFSTDPTSGSDFRKTFGIESKTPLLGMVGRWNAQKDHRNLLDAVAKLRHDWPDVQVLLAGGDCDDTNSELVELVHASELDDSVLLLGRRADIPALMNALDVEVLASSHGEAFPNVVAEAMACGTPCVVTDVGDAAEIVGDTGWVVQPRNPEALANALGVALAEHQRQETWKKRKDAARRRIETHYSIDEMVAKYACLWALAEIGRMRNNTTGNENELKRAGDGGLRKGGS